MLHGGTGGHITPGIAIANMLKEKGNEVIFVGTDKGMENDLVPKAGFELRHISAKGLDRGVSLKNISTIITLNKGVSECKKIIEDLYKDKETLKRLSNQAVINSDRFSSRYFAESVLDVYKKAIENNKKKKK